MKRIKRIISVIMMGVVTLGIMSLLFGCTKSDPLKYPDQNKKQDQGFYYIVSKGDTETTAIIVGLSGSGVIEELIIPEKLGGYRVSQIGYTLPPSFISAPERSWD